MNVFEKLDVLAANGSITIRAVRKNSRLKLMLEFYRQREDGKFDRPACSSISFPQISITGTTNLTMDETMMKLIDEICIEKKSKKVAVK